MVRQMNKKEITALSLGVPSAALRRRPRYAIQSHVVATATASNPSPEVAYFSQSGIAAFVCKKHSRFGLASRSTCRDRDRCRQYSSSAARSDARAG